MPTDFTRSRLRIFTPTLALALLTTLVLPSAPVCAGAVKGAAPAVGGVPELTQKPEHAVIGYITAYLYNDFGAVGHFDAAITAAIEEQLDPASGGGSMKADDAEKRQMELIRRNEREKRTNGSYAPFENKGRTTDALPPLYKVLYPGMKYRIIEVREAKPKAKGDAARQCAKEITVELSYPDIGSAPHHKGRRIKKGFVRVCLRKRPLQYKVCGYLPVRGGMEYFR